MPKFSTHSFVISAVLLFLVASSSALGASALHRETAHASRHRHTHRHQTGRRADHRSTIGAILAPTATMLLGDEAVESNRDSLTPGQAEAFPFQAASGTTGAVHVYIDSHDTARTLVVGLYTNLSGHPGALLTSGSLTSPQADAWNTATVAPAALVPGTTYWLAVLGTGGTLRYRDRAHGPCRAETSAQTYLAALSGSWRTGTVYSTCPISAYVTPAASILPEEPPVEIVPTEPPPPPPAAPANRVRPTIAGVSEEGQTLTANPGAWEGGPISYAYQWQDCDTAGANCTNISGASASTYHLGASDVGDTVVVAVTARNAGGSTTASSAPTATIIEDPPPPPPTAPTNTSPPAIGGSATPGQTLSSTTGTWTGSPTSYAYQWQDCSAAGANCTNISGASASTYKLGSGDVGDTVRVVVTASNAAGATAAASASIGPVGAAAPTASFTVAPASPTVGKAVTFDASSSTCPDGPCTYAWSDDGSTTRPIPALWPLGGGQTLQFTFSGEGTKYVRLVVSDASGQTATVEHNVEVQAEAIEPPPPSAPSNTSRPTVSGAARVGQTLTASSGTWSGSAPIAYAYQWQRDGTTNIAGATGPQYSPAAGDVGHTLDVLVTASNGLGQASSASAQTEAVAEGGGGGAQQTNCFSAPSACGYPDPTNSGVPAGTALEAQTGKIVVNAAGTTIKDLNLNGSIEVRANNTTIEDDEITVNGTQKGCSSPCGGNAIHIVSGVSGVVVKHVTCHGGAPSGENVTTFCFRNEGEATNRYEYNQVYNTAACFWGTGIYENNYCLDNGSIPNAHYDGIYFGGGADSIVMNHNTMFQPHEQTAAIFFSHDESNPQNITITNNFLAGGGFTIYGGGSGQNEFKVLGPVTVTGNRYARCLTKEINVEGGHHVCEGGYDTHGYYPNGGSYGLYAYFNEAVTTFSNNYWDDNLEPAS